MSDTRRRMIDTARQVIETEGVQALNMRNFGSLLSLSRSAVYKHFDSKEALLATIVAENFYILAETVSTLEISRDIHIGFSKIMHLYYEYGINNGNQYKLMNDCVWDIEKYGEVKVNAMALYHSVYKYIKSCTISYNTDEAQLKQIIAIGYAFINGLISLNLANHLEVEKGLDDHNALIELFIIRILNRNNTGQSTQVQEI